MAVISIEWGENSRVRWADATGVHTSSTLLALAERLPAASILLCEPSFYSCNTDERRFLAAELSGQSHVLVPAPRAGREVLEAIAGRVAARSRVGWLRAISVAGAAGLDHTVSREYTANSVHDALDIAHAVALGGVELPGLTAARQALGPYRDLDEPMRLALGDGQAYGPGVFAALALVAAVARSRDDFDRLLGLSESPGWGSVRGAVRGWYRTRNGGEDFVRESVLTWSAYRRALRAAYSRISAARRHGQERAA